VCPAGTPASSPPQLGVIIELMASLTSMTHRSQKTVVFGTIFSSALRGLRCELQRLVCVGLRSRDDRNLDLGMVLSQYGIPSRSLALVASYVA